MMDMGYELWKITKLVDSQPKLRMMDMRMAQRKVSLWACALRRKSNDIAMYNYNELLNEFSFLKRSQQLPFNSSYYSYNK